MKCQHRWWCGDGLKDFTSLHDWVFSVLGVFLVPADGGDGGDGGAGGNGGDGDGRGHCGGEHDGLGVEVLMFMLMLQMLAISC